MPCDIARLPTTRKTLHVVFCRFDKIIMGCLQSSNETKTDKTEEPPKKKTYTWNEREKLDPKDYILSDLKNETVARLPGKVNGQQFVIQNCENSKIYIFDHSATVTVDDSTNCQIFIGPSKGSVYIRDCKDCKFVIACQQFRTRDCKKLDVFLCCNTQPIIESSSGMKFACFQYYYPELEGQFDTAGLSLYNNNWSTIHDFTPAADEETWSLLPENVKVEDHIPIPPADDFPEIKVLTDQESSVVPLTLGSRRKQSDESSLVVFYPGSESRKTVRSFLKEIYLQTSCQIVRTKQVKMTKEDTKRVFGEEFHNEAIHQGAVIGLEVNGDDSVQLCNDILDRLLIGKNRSELVFTSTNKEMSENNIDSFYNFVDMTMS